ncbi:Protein EPD2 [Smittium mucronatum]|uniref:1,3-beta-glucanosyltransferase n=1 Tax=Smittium mucronatum TaxID=133383 RepID=A0A1R0GUD6_9FUNG|nr:Protein EPD2 [Smittium mucronatum]
MKLLSVISVLGLSLVSAIDPLTFKGSKIFNSNTKKQFWFKGTAYQPLKGTTTNPLDPLVDTVGCNRDIAVFKDLGLNAIRVYEVDSTKNHDVCMKALSDAGIYVLLDLPTPNYSINRDNPSWDIYLLNQYKLKIDAFSGYDNVAGFIVGNEVTNSANTTEASAFVKAAVRDVKAYMKAKSISIPVGYADNDDDEIRDSLISYFNCGDGDTKVDFYGVNTYRWCGDATFKSSGYNLMLEPFIRYSIPYFLTEYGCNTITPRQFKEVASMYDSDMEELASGGFLYEYSQEANNYGIVDVSYGNSAVTKLTDYDTFKKAMSTADPRGTDLQSYDPIYTDSTCPSVSSTWQVNTDLPPSPDVDLCNCLSTTFGCYLPSDFDSTNTTQSAAVSNQLSIICGVVDCTDISADPATGAYGKYSACSPIQKADWALSQYYAKNNNAASSCNVSGLGLNLTTNSNPSQLSSCDNTSGSSVTSDPDPNMGPDGLTNSTRSALSGSGTGTGSSNSTGSSNNTSGSGSSSTTSNTSKTSSPSKATSIMADFKVAVLAFACVLFIL